jgi:hypothetical protein
MIMAGGYKDVYNDEGVAPVAGAGGLGLYSIKSLKSIT